MFRYLCLFVNVLKVGHSLRILPSTYADTDETRFGAGQQAKLLWGQPALKRIFLRAARFSFSWQRQNLSWRCMWNSSEIAVIYFSPIHMCGEEVIFWEWGVWEEKELATLLGETGWEGRVLPARAPSSDSNSCIYICEEFNSKSGQEKKKKFDSLVCFVSLHF